MRRLKSKDPERQQLWRQGKRDFSIVDLSLLPDHSMLAEGEAAQVAKLLAEHYGKYRYEAAEMIGGRDAKGGPEIEIIGRFESFLDAKEYCEAYADGNVQIK